MPAGLIPITRIEGSDWYKAHMLRTLNKNANARGPRTRTRPRGSDGSLVEALTRVRDESRRTTNDEPLRIGTTSRPYHITTYTPTFEATFSAVQEVEHNANHVARFRPSHYGAMLTYPPNYCLDKWGSRGPPKDDSLMVEQDFDNLRISVADVGRYGPSIHHAETVVWMIHQDDLISTI